jgi:NADPH-dependent glutamate synthase beta subunit-like oxidoreductase
VKPTNTGGHDYYHKVVDCQWACPAHTPVPEYIRLIAGGRYSEAYMINWESNVFPGILGRVCDRPCEPACRRGRIDKEPVAICRLKRVAADLKDDIVERLPKIPKKNGKRVACIGAGPASLTVARDLVVQGYDVTIFDSGKAPGGMVRTQIPKFRLPDSVIDEECQYILDLGVNLRLNHWVQSLKSMVDDPQWDAIFVGTGAPRGRDADLPGRKEAAAHIHIGIDWLANVAFGHTKTVSPRVIVLGGGNTAMDCCRSARRLGGSSPLRYYHRQAR